MQLKKLKPGMTVYSVRASRSIGRKWDTWPVTIVEVNEEENKVFASWNYNEPKWWGFNVWSKWRIKDPNSRG